MNTDEGVQVILFLWSRLTLFALLSYSAVGWVKMQIDYDTPN